MALYRMHPALPSLIAIVWLAGCDTSSPPAQKNEPVTNVYLEALQEAEAVKQDADQRSQEQLRIDQLLGRDTATKQ